ncbi:MAG: hypothetical protein JEZ06_20675 [Anaerolineaceae bacterium]|nr:hypothetical protein [Anaerolineaceae bacterium]
MKNLILLIGKLILTTIIVYIISTGWYFWKHWDEPIDGIISEFQKVQAPMGMTFDEFVDDRLTGFAEKDKQRYEAGVTKNEDTCISTLKTFSPLISTGAIYHATIINLFPWSDLAEDFMDPDIDPLPDELRYGGVGRLPEAVWWLFVNDNWWFFTQKDRYCQLPTPQRLEY